MFKFWNDLNGLGKTALSIIILIPFALIAYFGIPLLSHFIGNNSFLISVSGNELNRHSIRASIIYSESQAVNAVKYANRKERKLNLGGAEIAINNNYYFCGIINFYNYQSKYDAPLSLEKDLRTLRRLAANPEVKINLAASKTKVSLDIAYVTLSLGQVSQDPKILAEAFPILRIADEANKLASAKFSPIRTKSEGHKIEPISRETVAIYNTYGNVNHQIGVMTGSNSKLRTAAKYFRKASMGREPEFPYSNLGCSQAELANITSDASLMRSAAKRFNSAMLEAKNKSKFYPMFKNNLGNSYQQQGWIKQESRNLRDAVKILLDTSTLVDRDDDLVTWPRVQHNLGNALLQLGILSENIVLFEKSVNAYTLALEDFSRSNLPIYWAASQNNLAIALGKLAILKNDQDMMLNAEKAFELALSERRFERMPMSWALTSNSLAQFYLDWAKLDVKSGNLSPAQEHLKLAQKILSETKTYLEKDYKASFNTFYSQSFADIDRVKQLL